MFEPQRFIEHVPQFVHHHRYLVEMSILSPHPGRFVNDRLNHHRGPPIPRRRKLLVVRINDMPGIAIGTAVIGRLERMQTSKRWIDATQHVRTNQAMQCFWNQLVRGGNQLRVTTRLHPIHESSLR